MIKAASSFSDIWDCISLICLDISETEEVRSLVEWSAVVQKCGLGAWKAEVPVHVARNMAMAVCVIFMVGSFLCLRCGQ